MKILTLVGTRPQFIKAHPVSTEIRKKWTEIIVHTGQHYEDELSDCFFRELDLPAPNYNLGVGSVSHAQQIGRMLISLEQVITKEKPDLVLVYGDTNSTLAGALASAQLRIPLAHVEAGLRSYNRTMPEEINRVISDHISNILFCPSQNAVKNLRKEGITQGVHNVGDVMVDCLKMHLEDIKANKVLTELNLGEGEYNLLTLHRAGNTDDIGQLKGILDAIVESRITTLFPVHPRTKNALVRGGLWEKFGSVPNLKLIPPLGYMRFLRLVWGCNKVLTDSGGVQKEAFLLGKPCITLRKETEWLETVEDGWNILAGADRNKILRAINDFSPSGPKGNHYGDGYARKRIVEIMESVCNV